MYLIEHADVEDFLAARAGRAARAIITDVPYCSGGATRGDRNACPLTKYGVDEAWDQTFEGDSRDERSFVYWCTTWMRRARLATAPGGILATFIDWRQYSNVTLAMQAAGWILRGLMMWDKGEGARPQPGRPRQQFELIPWASRGAYATCGLPPFRGVFPYTIRPGDKKHPTGKPVPVMDWLVGGFCPKGSLVLDPFCGAGSTGVAAISKGCSFEGSDSSEKWVQKARHRLEQHKPGEVLQLTFT